MKVVKTIVLDNRKIECEITYKNIKNLYLRVQQGKIKISANRYHSEELMKSLILKNKETILKQIDHYKATALYENNGYVYIFQKLYKIVLVDMNINKVAIHEDKLYVYSKRIQILVEQYLKTILLQYIKERIEWHINNDFHLPMPEIQIKKMKSRWGACFYEKNRVCFNLSLIHHDQRIIEYVIVHELSHFLQSNHSKAFYKEIEKRLPNYKQLEKRLKEISI